MARTATRKSLLAGHVYRARDLRRWGKNAARIASELVASGRLMKLAGGLYASPRRTKFGELAPGDREVMKAFLNRGPFVFTGPEYWNPLGLGSTAMFASQLVYNTKRSGEFTLGKKKFLLRRVSFPRKPTPEWFVVDLVENHAMAGVSRESLEARLAEAVRSGRFDPQELLRMAKRYGRGATLALVRRAVEAGTK